MTVYNGFNPAYPVKGLRVKGGVVLGRKPDVRTMFTVKAAGFKEGSATLADGAGNVLFTGGRSWNLVIFTRKKDDTITVSCRKYDVYGNATAGSTMSDDIQNIADGTDVGVFTYDEPFANKDTITDALLMLGATREKLNALPFRGSYILIGRKGMAAGQGKEYQVNAGGVQAQIVFVNGVMQQE
ncbi:hypothetical protein P4X47_001378 [Salmonella enterica]|uniref:ILEI/PANDER domain-containing protein n=2 Tax=Salmonella enterica TaxID=28901 RepID=A0A5Z7XSA9_SALNE|nr:hypothetical protein [Salmonella enterica]ECE9706344.1 hypothetical protein [Salmonella enterica subsp. enterica serovar Litchfield]ECS7533693.1 hypothetical protein [Salmonella enterica subsp. enterica serovar Newport]EDR4275287.1 hypothetical protein [Salmonella enterica subsp. enterica serovar Sandiego]EDX2041942.1 hypothetical protein [Salmonella enterica subsp. houtenae serovar 50:z4,z23:-]EEE1664512.1 hypothetical protein [Salmonella enterica subsp. houtenae serovar 48:z4,z32:-]